MITLIVLSLCLSLVIAEDQASCSNSVVPGPFTFTVGTTSTTGYLIQAGGTGQGKWGSVAPSGSSVTIGKGPRFYLANSCVSAFSQNAFSAVKLLGGYIQMTVDLSQIGCGLNAAFYLVSMPGPGATSNGDYYCDANCVGGQCCSEMDLMEANRHALQITPHRCTSATSGCDAGGCALNTQSITNGFGPSSSYTINTLNPFTVKISFITSGGSLTTITSVISQGSKSITLTHGSSCGSGYLSGFTGALSAGMVPVWSYWGGSMSWLDNPACSSDTPEVTGNFIFSNLVISGSVISTTGPPPPPPAAPGSLTCGLSSCTNNNYWVEFNAPSGVSGSSVTATVTCGRVDGVSGTVSYSCTWSGTKFQCNAPGPAGCSNPQPSISGKPCTLSTSAALSDSSALNTAGSSDQPLIIGLSVGLAVAVLIIVVLIVAFFLKLKNANYIETA